MNIQVVFNQVQAAKQRIFTLGDVNTLADQIESFMTAHGLDCGKVAEYESDIAAMLYEIAHNPDTEYSYVTMYVKENRQDQFNMQNTNFGSVFYLNSADTLLNYSKNEAQSFAPNFYFMIPNFVMLACYFDSYLNTIFSEINDQQLLDIEDVREFPNNRKKDKKFSVEDIFDSFNIHQKFQYLEQKIFNDFLYLKPFCLAEDREC